MATLRLPWPVCIGCHQRPDQIEEYLDPELLGGMTPDEYVRAEEGTYNPENGHFACTECYIRMGQPSRTYPDRWFAP